MNICEFEFNNIFYLESWQVAPPQAIFPICIPVDVVCPLFTIGIKSKIA